MSIHEDKKGTIWFGVNPGMLFKFNEDANNLSNSYFSKHNYFYKKPGDTRNYNIHSIISEKENLWILCASGILIKYNQEKENFETISENNILKDISIVSFLKEYETNFWFSSTKGLHHYNLESENLKSYYQTDGFHSNNYTRRSAFKSSNGELFFGSNNGVNSLYPRNMDKRESFAKLYINNIEILNKPAKSIIPEQVENGSERVKELNLEANQSSFSFQFSTIDNILNPNYYYAYRLKGFDKDWITSKKERIASYTNIPFGKYTFQVKAGSKQGIWDIDTKSITIKIKAPWWFSNLAILMYIFLATALIYGVIIWLRLKNKLAAEAWQNNKEKELYALIMNFLQKCLMKFKLL